jgi:hypothetical protein
MPAAPSWDPTGSYTTTFSDDFTGTSLNTAFWNPGWFGTGITGPVNTSECMSYNSANVSVSNSYLNLAITGGYAAIVNSNPSGGASTGFQFTGGSIEFRANLPASSGSTIANWPALWTDGQSWPTDGEMDVMEGLGGTAAYHFHDPAGGPGANVPGNYTGWHNFGAVWVPGGTVTYYYDGVQVGTISGVTSAPMYIIMGNQCGSPQVSPATMQVDWVYVWTAGGGGGGPVPPVNSGGTFSTITTTPTAVGQAFPGGGGTSGPGLSYRATPAITNSGTTSPSEFAVTKQAGTVATDWIFIYVYGGGAATFCSGFTTIADASNFSALLYRYADGTEPATFSVTGLYGTRPISVLITTIAGATSSFDPPVLPAPVSGTTGTAIPVNSITLNNPGDWVLWFAGDEANFGGAGAAISPPPGFTTRATNGSVAANATVLLADNRSFGTGATGVQTGSFALTISISSTSLPAATTGTPYSDTLAASGGDPPYTWSITSGALPSGLNLSSAGVISGTPGATTTTLQVTTTSLTGATTSTSYSATLVATGGSGSGYAWSITTGSLPAGLTLSTAGVISGTPTTAGTSSFTVQVKDSSSNTATEAMTLVVSSGTTSNANPVGPSGTWTLVFEDQFTGTAINGANWAVLQGASINSVTTSAANVSVSGGYARLVLSSGSTGAAICTYNHLAGTGIAGTGPSVSGPTLNVGDCCEASISFPGPGSPTGEFYNFPAWWASGADWPSNGEIDIIECYTGTPVSSYHGNGINSGIPAPSGNYANGFHTYTCVRGSSTVDIYWDGKLVWSYAPKDDGGPQNMIINVGVKAGEPQATGAASTVLVDYVRLWTPG